MERETMHWQPQRESDMESDELLLLLDLLERFVGDDETDDLLDAVVLVQSYVSGDLLERSSDWD